jgi:hypothetical protein
MCYNYSLSFAVWFLNELLERSCSIRRLIASLASSALLNFYNRNWHSEFYRNKSGTLETDPITAITVQLKDVEIGFKYYNTVAEANELGLPPEVYQVYQTFCQEMGNGFTRKDFQSMYFKKFRKPCGRSKASAFIEMLEQTGLVVQDEENSDKKTNHYKLADMCVEGVGDKTHSDPEQNPPHPPNAHILKKKSNVGFAKILESLVVNLKVGTLRTVTNPL